MADGWFRPKRNGYGAMPSGWKGWSAVAGFIAAITGLRLVLFGGLRNGGLSVPVAVIISIRVPCSRFAALRPLLARGPMASGAGGGAKTVNRRGEPIGRPLPRKKWATAGRPYMRVS
jgi:hypothetical protein